jgi:hypothetical protein
VPLRSRTRRIIRAIGYALIAGSGASGLMWPPASMQDVAQSRYVQFVVWCVLLMVGGVLSAYGSARGNWAGEYIGLPPLVAVFGIFGLAAALSGRGFGAASGVFLLFGLTGILGARWHEISALRREGVAARKDRDRGHSG